MIHSSLGLNGPALGCRTRCFVLANLRRFARGMVELKLEAEDIDAANLSEPGEHSSSGQKHHRPTQATSTHSGTSFDGRVEDIPTA